MGLCWCGGPSRLGAQAGAVFAAGGLRPNVPGGGRHSWGPAARLCLRGEAMTRWAPAPPGQEAPGCWAGWRCLPSVHSLYLSIKPFHPSSVPEAGWGGCHPQPREVPVPVLHLLPCQDEHRVAGRVWCHPDPIPPSPALSPAWTLPQRCWRHPIAILPARWHGATACLSQCSPLEVSACA